MRATLLLTAALSGVAVPLAAQVEARAPGPQYGAGALKRFFLGPEYRELWTTPIDVGVVRLDSLSPGLRPVARSGGQQTLGLRLRATDGKEFFFRSVDKDPSEVLPEDLHNTVVSDVVRDQTSSSHPTAPLVVDRLATAIELPHPTPHLVILPSDSTLGAFQQDFHGQMGFIEDRIGGRGVNGTWNGATEIIDSDTLEARTTASADDRVDARAFVRARLFDVFIGDWDRHRDQWRWARYGDGLPRLYRPIPLDRDQAFAKYDGFLLALARQTAPQLTNFASDFPAPVGQTWNGRDLDRRYLVGLEESDWKEAALELRSKLTDSVIEDAVRALPPQHYDLIGMRLTAWLKARRDKLPEQAERYRRLLAAEVDLHGTAQSDVATVTAEGDASFVVELRKANTDAPFLRRRFLKSETNEVRIYLGDGADTASTRNVRRVGGVHVRVLGEGGADQLDNRGGGNFYDDATGPSFADRRPYVLPPRPEGTAPPRDWGGRTQWIGWSSFGPDLGLFIGTGVTFTNYGFRKLPYASKHRIRAGFATGPGSYRVNYLGQWRRENSSVETSLLLQASGIEINRFHGFGNETEIEPGEDDEFYRVTSDQYLVAPSIAFALGKHATFSIGPELKYVSTDERSDRFLTTVDPYGDGNFGEVGGRASFRVSTRKGGLAALSGVSLEVGGSIHPDVWDVEETFGDAYGELRTWLTPGGSFRPTLALRAGGRKVWGTFPYFESAFIGGPETVRLGRENRFAGDAAVYGGSELRIPLARLTFIVPSDFGILGLADIGRVFLDGESSDEWHGAVGGGMWLGFLSRTNAISVVIAKSEERSKLYVQAGFGF
ncbi:MAG TPA: hypothetical protein VG817_07845 [Gemmatimonadales bacterium]|nr:hypothetical protein [Gemmatimonadales bacterium]